MDFEEHVGKARVLTPAGIAVPRGVPCASPAEARAAAEALGPCVVKAQVATGKRGKAGGIRLAATPDEAEQAAAAMLGLQIGDHRVERLLVEEQMAIARELYAAVLLDVEARRPLVLFSTEGGMDIEEVAAERPAAIRRRLMDVTEAATAESFAPMLAGLGLDAGEPAIADVLARLYRAYGETDAELIEINPLAMLADGGVVALDCKYTLDDAAAYRQEELARLGTPGAMTELERRGAALGLKFIELDGNVGVLANGAGLTMTTMDTIRHLGGRPANFLEIGGEAYTRAEAALALVLANPGVKSLVVNFCGAFARTDVMAEGVVRAWAKLKPRQPVFFSIHGTGEAEAVALVRRELGIEPYDLMEDAVLAAVKAAQ
jgi:succinyl-CoA synthetase beta subunit